MTAGNQPPLGVMETTQPSLSAASTEVVPRHNLSIYSGSIFGFNTCCITTASCTGIALLFDLVVSVPVAIARCFNKFKNGFCFPSNG